MNGAAIYVDETQIEKLKEILPNEYGKFMFMGVYEPGSIFLFKHYMTRRYINIDAAGKCYQYDQKMSYKEIPKEQAVKWVLN